MAAADRPVPVHEATKVNPPTPSRETLLFVVHVWRQRTRFRASVRRVDCEQALLFTTPTQLARYLSAAAGGPVDEAGQVAAAQPPPGAPTP